jgi:hypothetical protein
MTIVGASFLRQEDAEAAEAEMTATLHLTHQDFQMARLGAYGEPQDGRILLAGQVGPAQVGKARQIITRHGGSIVANQELPD